MNINVLSSPSHYVKIVYVPGFSEIYFPAFGLNKEIYIVNLSIQSKCGETQTRKNYLDIFSKDSTESFADASPNLTYGPNGYDH